MSTPAPTMTQAERERLQRLLAQAPLAEMADELADYYSRLRERGFKKWQAWNMTWAVHNSLCESVFEL